MMRRFRLIFALAALALGSAACSPSLPSESRIATASPRELAGLRGELAAVLKDDARDAQAQFLMARVLLRAGEADAAEVHAVQAARALPFDGVVMNLLGEIQLAQGRRFRALAAFSQAISFERDLIAAYVNLANTHHALEQGSQAVQVLRDAIVRAPNYYPARYHLARILHETRRHGEAAREVTAARRMRPGAMEALLLEIRIKNAQGHLSVARLIVEEALLEHPGSRVLQGELLDILHQRQDGPAALALLERMARDGALTPREALRKVDILQAQGEQTAADDLLRKLLRLHPQDAGVQVAHARGMLGSGDVQSALGVLNSAVAGHPESVEAHYWKAVAHYRLRQRVRGDAALAAAERLAPGHPRVRLLRARRLLVARKLGPARKLLAQYLEVYPADGNALLVRSEMLTLLGDFSGAERNLREIAPGASGQGLRFARARLAYLRGAYDAVLKETRPVANGSAAPWQLVYLHGAALLRLGRPGEALPVVRPYLAKPHGGAHFHRLAGDLYNLAGDRGAAEKTYLAGLARFPRDANLLQALTRLAIEDGRWEQAREWLESGIERASPQLAWFLERLSLVHRKLNQPAQARQYLRRYLAETDPLLRERTQADEHGILFNSAFPVIGYSMLVPAAPSPPR
ncbi:MAG: tetratricopeptide repeat protein [SAR324 cluster bacterium]|nr:tetratricopeptide repeat protein [SAR324 cluster bacterium]